MLIMPMKNEIIHNHIKNIEILPFTFVINPITDVEPEILEKVPDQIFSKIFISDKDVTPVYFHAVLYVSGNMINYTLN